MVQWNRMESSEINPRSYGQNLHQRSQKYTKRKKFLQQVVLGKLDSHMQIKVTTHPPTIYTHTHTKSKQLKDLNLRHDTIKLLEEDISKTFSDVNHTCVIVGRSPKTTEIKTNEI